MMSPLEQPPLDLIQSVIDNTVGSRILILVALGWVILQIRSIRRDMITKLDLELAVSGLRGWADGRFLSKDAAELMRQDRDNQFQGVTERIDRIDRRPNQG